MPVGRLLIQVRGAQEVGLRERPADHWKLSLYHLTKLENANSRPEFSVPDLQGGVKSLRINRRWPRASFENLRLFHCFLGVRART